MLLLKDNEFSARKERKPRFRVLKKGFFLLLALVVFAIVALRPIVVLVYLAKGVSYNTAKKMGVHTAGLFTSNMSNISLLFDFFDDPVFTPHPVRQRLFGLNVAPPANPVYDEILVADLEQLGVKHLRIDYGFGYEETTERIDDFLEKISGRFDILLHIVQHPEKASAMGDPVIQEEWRMFLEKTLSRHLTGVNAIEIGSIPNRKKWSGYTIPDYLEAVRIAMELAEKYKVLVFGPNIQDFEPFWQVTFLDMMESEGLKFHASTGNLFVDRAVQPELYDTHVAGERLADLAAMDLLNKSRFLDVVSESFGVDELICTYTQWNLDVPAHFYFASAERLATPDRYADYLLRFYVLSAAGGYLDRVYWGEYASYKEGLVDDGLNPLREERPLPDSHHKFVSRGDIRLYKKRAAFFTYKTMVDLLAGSSFVRRPDTKKDVYVFEFSRGENDIYVLWTLNGMRENYSIPLLDKCRGIGRDGEALEIPGSGLVLSGTPVYVVCGE